MELLLATLVVEHVVLGLRHHQLLLLLISHVHQELDRVLNQVDDRVAITILQLIFLPQKRRLVIIVDFQVTSDFDAQVEFKDGHSKRGVGKIKRLARLQQILMREKTEAFLLILVTTVAEVIP